MSPYLHRIGHLWACTCTDVTAMAPTADEAWRLWLAVRGVGGARKGQE